MAIAFGPVTDEESGYSPIEDGRYLFHVSELEGLPPNEYGTPRIKWNLLTAEHVNGKWVPVLDGEGQQYVKFMYTNLPKPKADGSPNPMGPNNQTRLVIEAILGRKLKEGETASEDMVLGKNFIALLGPHRSKTNPNKISQVVLTDRIQPFESKNDKAEAAPPPPPPPAEDEDTGLPF